MAATDQRFPYVPAGGGTTYHLIGERITFKITSAQTGDAFSVMELTSPPGGGPPLHTHAAAETFFILAGAFAFSGLDQGAPYAIRATPGDVVHIPGGAPHTYKTVSPTPGRALGVLAPGGEMERFFAAVGTRVRDDGGPAGAAGPPSEEEIARHLAIAARHGITFLLPERATAAPATASGVWHG